jgi:hypothetical protein
MTPTVHHPDTPPVRRLRRALAVMLVVPAVLAGACAAEESAASKIGISPEAFTQIIEGEEDFLSPATERKVEAWIGYVDGDRVVRIGNGGNVPLGSMDVAFTISPFPPTQFDVEVDLVFTGPDGMPADVTVEAWYDMVFMTHGQPIADVERVGSGRFRLPLDLFMFGPWVVKATVGSPAGASDLPLIIYVWPKV